MRKIFSDNPVFILLILNSKLEKIFSVKCSISHLHVITQVCPLPENILWIGPVSVEILLTQLFYDLPYLDTLLPQHLRC